MKTNNNFKGKAMATVLIVFALVCISQLSFAQDRWSIELRPGVNFPIEKLGEANLNTGFGAEATLAYRFIPHLAVYAGWGWNKFGSDLIIDDINLDFEETGYTYGLQFIHEIGSSNIGFLVRAGGLANHIEVEKGDDIIFDSGHGFGWQVEGGLVINIGEHFRLLPSVRYRSLNRDLEINNITTNVDLNYLSAGLGLAVIF